MNSVCIHMYSFNSTCLHNFSHTINILNLMQFSLRFTKIRNVQNNINTGVNKLYNTQVTTIFFENFTFSMSNKIQMIKVKNNLKLQH